MGVAVEARDVSQPNASFETLLLHLKENRGFDFTGYKRASLTRRVDHELQSTNDQLHVINDELHDRTDDLNEAKQFLERY